MIRLLALDLDGTLLNRDKEVSEKNRAALRAAMDAGVYVTLATGRMLNSALYFGRLIGANAPLIACNGALVQAMDSARPVFARTYPKALAQEFLRFAVGRGWYVQWHSGVEIYSTDYRPEYFDAYRTVPGFTVRSVGERYLDYTDDVLQFVLRDRTGERMPAMLAELAKYLSVRADEVMACGDADNDLTMLRWAGTAVVPDDGQQAAKDLATYIAPPCDEDAVAAAVEKFVLRPAGA